MPTPTPRRRIDPSMTPAQKRQAVEEMLRELAYVLHVTRKVTRQIDRKAVWPKAAARPASAENTPAASA